jgi:hypothetical protein
MWADELWRDGIANPNLVDGRASIDLSSAVLKNAKPSAEITDRAAELRKVAATADAALSRQYTAAADALTSDNPGPPQRLLDAAAARVTAAILAPHSTSIRPARGPGNGQPNYLRSADGTVHDVSHGNYKTVGNDFLLIKRDGNGNG